MSAVAADANVADARATAALFLPPTEVRTCAGGGAADDETVAKASAASLLRNYRLRRRVGLLPASAAAAGAVAPSADRQRDGDEISSEEALRWARLFWRPRGGLELPAAAATVSSINCAGDRGVGGRGVCRNAGVGAEEELAAEREAAALHHRVEQRFGELNAERRNHVALAEGLRRQGESAAAIRAETERLRSRLEETRREVQERTVASRLLSERLGIDRRNAARFFSQAAALASAVRQTLDADCDGSTATGCGTSAGASSGAEAGVPDSARRELAVLRAQISALVEESTALSARLRDGTIL